MDISGKVPPVNKNPYIDKIAHNRRTAKTTSPATNAVEKGDKVHLSRTAKEIREARKILESLPMIREEKVAAIKMRLEEGTYHIDAERIADKMLWESLENERL